MNPARQTYAKALTELQNRSKAKQQPTKTGGYYNVLPMQ